MKYCKILLIGVTLLLVACGTSSEGIGSVSTKFNFTGSDKIVVEAIDDHDIKGVSCFLSRAKTGGISGAVGLAEDGSDASIECAKVGELVLPDHIPEQAEVFKKSTSIMFKSIQVIRFYDEKRKALIYLTYSDKLIEGSPKNSISVVVIE